MIRIIKKGFTLTEILLAMSVIGIISAIVLPQVIHSTQKDKAGVVLGKAVEQIELGCQNMIQAYNSRDDAEASMADSLMAMDGAFSFSFDRLAPYIGVVLIPAPPQENGPMNLMRGDEYRFTKLPAEISLPGVRMIFDMNHQFTLDDRILRDITIDTNGLQNNPNQPGRDQFIFDLRNDGKLVPHGLNVHTCDGDNPTINGNCTARVVRDGFKIKYD